jgi:hypothetical protein
VLSRAWSVAEQVVWAVARPPVETGGYIKAAFAASQRDVPSARARNKEGDGG